ncbi:arsenic metallochaperone ArsD family protein [Sorangium sp. So ce295]|uniref:arsenic metallochaperone ArsD family protein n=1 Tax=Sorangium sp. So ce295 TaxID=3133295 RepID=UPI003F62D51E
MKEALARGTEVLPLVLVGDRIAVEGAYPSREALAALRFLHSPSSCRRSKQVGAASS